jgi:sulfatase modifying factor 1
MHGNVYEWCADLYDGAMKVGVDRKGPDSGGDLWVHCGLSWFDWASLCRSALRFRLIPNTRGNCLGFRSALVPSR